jgi:mycothiol synthase
MEDEIYTPEMLTEEDALTQKAGWVPWNYVAVHKPTGEWGGYTRLFPGVFRPQFAYQDDTGVRPEHRNRGLGRWLKATMLLKLMDERPQTRWVDTWNATVNEPMLNINHAMGFRRILKYQEWEIPSEELLTVLRKRAAAS